MPGTRARTPESRAAQWVILTSSEARLPGFKSLALPLASCVAWVSYSPSLNLQLLLCRDSNDTYPIASLCELSDLLMCKVLAKFWLLVRAQ